MTNQSKEAIAEAKEKAIYNAPSLYNYKLIARSVGRDEDTLLRWRTEDEEFADKLDQARTAFIQTQMGKARPDFLLERLEKEIFAPPVNKTESTTIDPVMILLQKFGVMEAIEGERKTTDTVQDPPESGT